MTALLLTAILEMQFHERHGFYCYQVRIIILNISLDIDFEYSRWKGKTQRGNERADLKVSSNYNNWYYVCQWM